MKTSSCGFAGRRGARHGPSIISRARVPWNRAKAPKAAVIASLLMRLHQTRSGRECDRARLVRPPAGETSSSRRALFVLLAALSWLRWASFQGDLSREWTVPMRLAAGRAALEGRGVLLRAARAATPSPERSALSARRVSTYVGFGLLASAGDARDAPLRGPTIPRARSRRAGAAAVAVGVLAFAPENGAFVAPYAMAALLSVGLRLGRVPPRRLGPGRPRGRRRRARPPRQARDRPRAPRAPRSRRGRGARASVSSRSPASSRRSSTASRCRGNPRRRPRLLRTPSRTSPCLPSSASSTSASRGFTPRSCRADSPASWPEPRSSAGWALLATGLVSRSERLAVAGGAALRRRPPGNGSVPGRADRDDGRSRACRSSLAAAGSRRPRRPPPRRRLGSPSSRCRASRDRLRVADRALDRPGRSPTPPSRRSLRSRPSPGSSA